MCFCVGVVSSVARPNHGERRVVMMNKVKNLVARHCGEYGGQKVRVCRIVARGGVGEERVLIASVMG
jgi:hypothetical protein